MKTPLSCLEVVFFSLNWLKNKGLDIRTVLFNDSEAVFCNWLQAVLITIQTDGPWTKWC
jgi:hypothetical protein